MLDIIQKHLNSFSKGDWDAYKKDFAEGADYLEVATQRRAHGGEEIVKLIQRWRRAFPDLQRTIKNSVVAGNTCMVELEWAGTHKGAFDGPLGTIAPTGKFGKVPAAMVLTIKGGKIASTHHYFDLMTVLAQMGMGARAFVQAQTGAPAVH